MKALKISKEHQSFYGKAKKLNMLPPSSRTATNIDIKPIPAHFR